MHATKTSFTQEWWIKNPCMNHRKSWQCKLDNKCTVQFIWLKHYNWKNLESSMHMIMAWVHNFAIPNCDFKSTFC